MCKFSNPLLCTSVTELTMHFSTNRMTIDFLLYALPSLIPELPSSSDVPTSSNIDVSGGRDGPRSKNMSRVDAVAATVCVLVCWP